MLTITCPFCGPRSENEFVHGGPARVVRPENVSEYDTQDWIDYLTHTPNPVGVVSEKWWHARGCGAWLSIERDTTTHVIVEPADETQSNTPGDKHSDNTAS